MAAATFAIGEVAFHTKWKMEVTVESSLKHGSTMGAFSGHVRVGVSYYQVSRADGRRNPMGANIWAGRPAHLRRLPPPNRRSSWGKCVWKPKSERLK